MAGALIFTSPDALEAPNAPTDGKFAERLALATIYVERLRIDI
jgi:hypothetical protein